MNISNHHLDDQPRQTLYPFSEIITTHAAKEESLLADAEKIYHFFYSQDEGLERTTENRIELNETFLEKFCYQLFPSNYKDPLKKIFSSYPSYIYGGYAIYLIEYFFLENKDNFSLNELVCNYASRHTYADYDFRIDCEKINQDIILEYLSLCKLGSYIPIISDISLSFANQDLINQFEVLYFNLLGIKCPFKIQYNLNAQKEYLHLNIEGKFDITFNFSSKKEIPLFSINQTELSLNRSAFINTNGNIIQTYKDIACKVLVINDPLEANPKACWKAWLYFLKGYRCIQKDKYLIIVNKSLKKLEEATDLTNNAVSLIHEFCLKHGENDLSFACCIFTYLAQTFNLNEEQLEEIKCKIKGEKRNETIYSQLLIWNGNLNLYFSLIQFAALWGLYIPRKDAKAFLITHLNETYLQITDTYSCLLKYDEEKIINCVKNLIKTDSIQFVAYTLCFLFERLVPLNKIDNIETKIPSLFESIAIEMMESTSSFVNKLGSRMLMQFYLSNKNTFDHRFLEKLPFILLHLSNEERNAYIPLICKLFNLCQKHWFIYLLEENNTSLFLIGWVLVLRELNLLSSSLRIQASLKNYTQELQKLLFHLLPTYQDRVELFFIEEIKLSTFSFTSTIELYKQFSLPKKITKKAFIHFLTCHIDKKKISIDISSLYCECVLHYIKKDFSKAYTLWKNILNRDGFICSALIYKNTLQQLQKAFLDYCYNILKETDRYEGVLEKVLESITNKLWSEDYYIKDLYEFLSYRIIENFALSTDEINQIIEIIQKNHISFKNYSSHSQGSVYCLLEVLNNSKLVLHEECVLQSIRDIKKNKDRPQLEMILIQKCLEKIPSIDLQNLQIITNFLIFISKDKPTTLKVKLFKKFLKDINLSIATYNVLSYLDWDCYDLLIEFNGEINQISQKTIQRFFKQVLQNKRTIEEEKLYTLFKKLKSYLVDQDIIRSTLENFTQSMNFALITEIILIILKDFPYLKDLKNKCIEKNLDNDQFDEIKKILLELSQKAKFNLLKKVKSKLSLEKYYKEFLSDELFNLYVKFEKVEIILYDVNHFFEKNDETTLKIIKSSFKTNVSSHVLKSFLQIFIKLNEIYPTQCDLLKKNLEKDFLSIGYNLKKINALDIWSQVATILDVSIFFEKKGKYTALFIDAMQQSKVSDDSFIYVLIKNLLNTQDVSKHLLVVTNEFSQKFNNFIANHLTFNLPLIAKLFTTTCILQFQAKIVFTFSPIDLFLQFDYPESAFCFFCIPLKKDTPLSNKEVDDLEKICRYFISKPTSMSELIKIFSNIIPYLRFLKDSIYNDLIFTLLNKSEDCALMVLKTSKKLTIPLLHFLLKKENLAKKFFPYVFNLCHENKINQVSLEIIPAYLRYLDQCSCPIDFFNVFINFSLSLRDFKNTKKIIEAAIISTFSKLQLFDGKILRDNLKNITGGFLEIAVFLKPNMSIILNIQNLLIEALIKIKDTKKSFEFCQELLCNLKIDSSENISLFLETVCTVIKYGFTLYLEKGAINLNRITELVQILNLHKYNKFYKLLKEYTLDAPYVLIEELIKGLDYSIQHLKSDEKAKLEFEKYQSDCHSFFLNFREIFIDFYQEDLLENLKEFSSFFKAKYKDDFLHVAYIYKNKKIFEELDKCDEISILNRMHELFLPHKDLPDLEKKSLYYYGVIILKKHYHNNFKFFITECFNLLTIFYPLKINIESIIKSILDNFKTFKSFYEVEKNALLFQSENIPTETKIEIANFYLDNSNDLRDYIQVMIEALLNSLNPTSNPIPILHFIHYHIELLVNHFSLNSKILGLNVATSFHHLAISNYSTWNYNLKFCNSLLKKTIQIIQLQKLEKEMYLNDQVLIMFSLLFNGKHPVSENDPKVSKMILEQLFLFFEKITFNSQIDDFRPIFLVEIVSTIFLDKKNFLPKKFVHLYLHKTLHIVFKNGMVKIKDKDENFVSLYRSFWGYLIVFNNKYPIYSILENYISKGYLLFEQGTLEHKKEISLAFSVILLSLPQINIVLLKEHYNLLKEKFYSFADTICLLEKSDKFMSNLNLDKIALACKKYEKNMKFIEVVKK